MTLTDSEAFNFASQIMDEGIAHRAQMQIDPPLHIVTENGELWCTGGPAHKGENTPHRRYCRRCLTLAREMHADLADPDFCDHCEQVVTPDRNGYWVGADDTSECAANERGHEVAGRIAA